MSGRTCNMAQESALLSGAWRVARFCFHIKLPFAIAKSHIIMILPRHLLMQMRKYDNSVAIQYATLKTTKHPIHLTQRGRFQQNRFNALHDNGMEFAGASLYIVPALIVYGCFQKKHAGRHSIVGDEVKPFNEKRGKRSFNTKENRLCIHKGDHLELMGGFEPPTSSLPRMRATDGATSA